MSDEIQYLHEELESITKELEKAIKELEKKKLKPEVKADKVGMGSFLARIPLAHRNALPASLSAAHAHPSDIYLGRKYIAPRAGAVLISVPLDCLLPSLPTSRLQISHVQDRVQRGKDIYSNFRGGAPQDAGPLPCAHSCNRDTPRRELSDLRNLRISPGQFFLFCHVALTPNE